VQRVRDRRDSPDSRIPRFSNSDDIVSVKIYEPGSEKCNGYSSRRASRDRNDRLKRARSSEDREISWTNTLDNRELRDRAIRSGRISRMECFVRGVNRNTAIMSLKWGIFEKQEARGAR
jgi:hypothetical protein